MIRILLLAALAALAGTVLSRLYRRYGVWGVLLALAALALAVLVATGRAHWISIAALGALALAKRLVWMFVPQLLAALPAMWRRRLGGGARSQFRTAMLAVTLDPLTGRMEGSVLRGPLAGRSLDELSEVELRGLLAQCQREDPPASLLLQSYIAYAHPDWQAPGAAPGDDAPPPSSTMGLEQARAVLGVEEGADRDAVLAAYRRLVQRLHPDRGGNPYLASMINQARDLLLEAHS